MNVFRRCTALEGMATIPSGSIPLAVTSPPYGSVRDYGGHTFDFEPIAHELHRVIRPGGVLCWHVGDTIDEEGSESLQPERQSIFFRCIGWTIYQKIYVRTNCPRPPTRRYARQTSIVLVLSKGRPDTVNLLRDRENATAGRVGRLHFRGRDGSPATRRETVTATLGYRGDCWHYLVGGPHTTADRYAYAHPALMPEGLARDLILSYSKAWDVVLDPMAGAATTCKMALLASRRYVGFEPWETAFRLGERRIEDARKRLLARFRTP